MRRISRCQALQLGRVLLEEIENVFFGQLHVIVEAFIGLG